MSAALTDGTAGQVRVAPPGIDARGLKRSFDDVRAVDGITFTAPAGAVTALIGPNGAGKTTLLLLLAGLLRADEGTATIAGFDVARQNLQARCQIGWMPDSFGTWEALTCSEVLTTFARAYGLGREEARSRVAGVLDLVHLAEFAQRPARVLSRGQKQRLGLARALVHDPAVLLLDEPASGLDPRSRVELRELLRGLAASGKTVLVSSHVLAELEELYDYAVFLSKGRSVDITQAAHSAGTTRGWRLEALEANQLRDFLDRTGVPWTPGPGAGEVTVPMIGAEAASELIKAAVAAGVALHTIAPVSGRLEAAYLSLNEDRV